MIIFDLLVEFDSILFSEFVYFENNIIFILDVFLIFNN